MIDNQIVTHLIKVDPKSEPGILLLLAESNQLRDYAIARVITTVEDVKSATNDLAIISKIKKTMESKRKEYLQPFQEHVKEVNDDYKVLMSPVEDADKITRSKILAFQADQERKRREVEAIEAEKLALARREAELNGGEITIDLRPIAKPEIVPARVTTNMGSMGTRDNWKLIEVTDFAALPDEYKIADFTKLGKVIRAGLHTIPGCKIENVPILAVSSK